MTGAIGSHPFDLAAAVRHAGDEASRLAMQLGDEHWLLDPADVAEVIPAPQLAQVPFTKHWFAGVASIRGNPLCVVDLNAFFGGAVVDNAERVRLVVVAERHRINSALLFTRMLGLEPFDRFVREPQASLGADWIEGHYRDRDGQRWTALSMHALLTHPDFLHIELSA